MEDEISDGVKILCERMETHPEEFVETEFDPSTMRREVGKFYYEGKAIESLAKGEPAGAESLWYMNDTERTMLVNAYRKMLRQSHTTHIVSKLLEQPEPEPEPAKHKGPLAKGQLLKELTPGLNDMFAKEYAAYRREQYRDAEAKLKYKATGRYAMGWDGEPLTDPWKKK